DIYPRNKVLKCTRAAILGFIELFFRVHFGNSKALSGALQENPENGLRKAFSDRLGALGDFGQRISARNDWLLTLPGNELCRLRQVCPPRYASPVTVCFRT